MPPALKESPAGLTLPHSTTHLLDNRGALRPDSNLSSATPYPERPSIAGSVLRAIETAVVPLFVGRVVELLRALLRVVNDAPPGHWKTKCSLGVYSNSQQADLSIGHSVGLTSGQVLWAPVSTLTHRTCVACLQ
eukprot:2750522-Pyramimonas_sp.AAC.1